MSAIKNKYHEEICKGLYGSVEVKTKAQKMFDEYTKGSEKRLINTPIVGWGNCETSKLLKKK